MPVQVLDEVTINKIAAGEVVERPASVIKELVENALDAKATKIEIEIAAGGTSLMRVTDNGCGMSRSDATLAIRRHATSKIAAVGDLYALSTLGFRGEALPTIASVSRFSLRTREETAELGTEIQIVGGKEPEVQETGCAIGTRIQVEDLFFNTPARKKFLKTTQTEGARISDFVAKLALSHPEVAFRFISNNKLSLQTPGNGSLFDTIQSIYGKETADSLLSLFFEDVDIRITGYITKPNMLKSSRSWQTVIVNDRIISNKAIAKAIDNAYRSMVPKAGFPLIVLCLEVPQRSIDVNVHPQKTEMKFEDEGRIFKAVYKAVLDAVRPEATNSAGEDLHEIAAHVKYTPRSSVVGEGGAFVFSPAKAAVGEKAGHTYYSYQPSPPTLYRPSDERLQEGGVEGSLDFHAVQTLLHEPTTPYNTQVNAGDGIAATEHRDLDSTGEMSDIGRTQRLAGEIFPVGQVAKCYIIAQDGSGLYLIDQHAAHERILYDRFARESARIPAQQLLVHKLLTFDRRECELIDAHLDLFSSLGFSMESVGDRDYRLMEIPTDLTETEAEDVVREILTDLIERHETSAEEIRHTVLAVTACRAAIKAGEVLNLRQMELLLEELAGTERPYTCPHGRPTILKFSSEELAKMFKRT